MKVLGLNTMENASACLVCDQRIIAAAEEERFTRKKHQEGVPVQAISYCLQEGGLRLSDVDVVALNWQPWRIGHRALHVLRLALSSPGRFARKAARGTRQVTGNEWGRMISLPRRLPGLLGEKASDCHYRFRYIDHHLCHAASTFYPSAFGDSAILIVDGAGEDACITLAEGRGAHIKILKTIRLPHSLGHLYSAATAFLGFRPCSGEGKVMGLASYGADTYGDVFERMVSLDDGGGVRLDFKWLDYHLALSNTFPKRTVEMFGTPRAPESALDKRHEDLACSLQTTLERCALHITNELHRRTKLPALCLAGGVALNSKMNRYLLEASPFEEIFIQPAAGDAGTALGAALAADPPRNVDDRHTMRHALLGPSFGDDDITKAIADNNLQAIRCSDIAHETAKLLAEGKIVGWFQGRMEFGPRALGARSILADPRRADMKDILNHRVKHREAFRPFAPATLAERADEYFLPPTHCPFMLQVVPVRDEACDVIPAVVHVDKTARLQTVTEDANPMFYDLIRKFDAITQVPVVVNTSFNIRGEPIVCTPHDAIACFATTGLDALAIGSHLLVKNGSHPACADSDTAT